MRRISCSKLTRSQEISLVWFRSCYDTILVQVTFLLSLAIPLQGFVAIVSDIDSEVVTSDHNVISFLFDTLFFYLSRVFTLIFTTVGFVDTETNKQPDRGPD